MINGYTAICLTKLDILYTLPELKITIAYKVNETKINCSSSSALKLEEVEVEYLTLPGWQQGTEEIRKFKDLPDKFKQYVNKIEGFINVPVKWIGVSKMEESIVNSYW